MIPRSRSNRLPAADQRNRASAAPNVNGRRVRQIAGLASAGIPGILSIPAASVRHVFINGKLPRAFGVWNFPRTPTGTRRNEETQHHEKPQIPNCIRAAASGWSGDNRCPVSYTHLSSFVVCPAAKQPVSCGARKFMQPKGLSCVTDFSLDAATAARPP